MDSRRPFPVRERPSSFLELHAGLYTEAELVKSRRQLDGKEPVFDCQRQLRESKPCTDREVVVHVIRKCELGYREEVIFISFDMTHPDDLVYDIAELDYDMIRAMVPERPENEIHGLEVCGWIFIESVIVDEVGELEIVVFPQRDLTRSSVNASSSLCLYIEPKSTPNPRPNLKFSLNIDTTSSLKRAPRKLWFEM